MPCLITNLEALEHNIALITDLCRQWGVRYLPVLKMVAGHPMVCRMFQSYGYTAIGMADIDEPEFFSHRVSPSGLDEPEFFSHQPSLSGTDEPEFFSHRPSLSGTVEPEFFSHQPSPSGTVEPEFFSHRANTDGKELDKVLINLFPLSRAGDVVRTYCRSAVSCLAAVQALEKAAAQQGVQHNALLMIDLGDLREGVTASEAAALAATIRQQNLQHVRIVGLGTTLGCLHGVCPDAENMALLQQTALDVEAALGHSLEVISLGGSIFFDWFAQHAPQSGAGWPSGCTVEFRAGDPALLGYDMYNGRPFSVPGFRRDIFTLRATVVELAEKEDKPCRTTCLTGQGTAPKVGCGGRRKRALLDCGRLHTEISELDLQLPGASIVDFSGNYTILDVTECPQPLAVGDEVSFLPRYWAVAKALRVATVSKQFIG